MKQADHYEKESQRVYSRFLDDIKDGTPMAFIKKNPSVELVVDVNEGIEERIEKF
jgi:hypothetical protein